MDGSVVKRTYCFCRRSEFGSSTHIKWLTGAFNSSSKGYDAAFGTPVHCAHVHLPTHMHTQVHGNKNKTLKKKRIDTQR